jgi:hypothetical protein
MTKLNDVKLDDVLIQPQHEGPLDRALPNDRCAMSSVLCASSDSAPVAVVRYVSDRR